MAIADKHRITLYGGAIRGGKSYWLCLLLLAYCFKYPGSRWLIVRETQPTMRRTILQTFDQLMDKGLHRYLKGFNQQTMTATFNNSSQIIFMSESYDTDKDLNRFRGLEINGAGIDELNEMQEATFNKIIERSGSWNGAEGCPVKILATCNPTDGWVRDKFYKPWSAGSLPNGFAYVPAKITDNPYLSPDYLESLKSLPRYEYEVFVNGNWDLQVKKGGEFYKCFQMDKHIGKVNYDPSLPLHISWDENVNPYLPCGIFQIAGKALYMIDEIAGRNPGNSVPDVCREIKRKYPGHTAGLFVYGDATSQKRDVKLENGSNFYRLIQDHLAEYRPSLRVLSSNPSVTTRGNFINTILETGFGGISLLIDEHCQLTIADFTNTKEASDGRKHKETALNEQKVQYQKAGHFTDLTDYLICYAFRDEFQTYLHGSKSMNWSAGRGTSKNTY